MSESFVEMLADSLLGVRTAQLAASTLLSHPSAIALIVDAQWRVLWLNDTAAAASELEGAVLGQLFSNGLPDLIVEREGRAPRLVAEGGLDDVCRDGPEQFHLQWDGLHGRTRWRCACFPIAKANDSGLPLYGLTAVDITAQFLAEQAQQAAEERFAAFMWHIPAAAVIKDAANRYVWANPAYFHLFGVEPENFVGKRRADFADPEDACRTDRMDLEVMNSGRADRDTVPFVRPDGSVGTHLVHRFPLALPDRTTGMGAVFLDVTEQRLARDSAEAADTRWRELFEQVGLPIIVFDLQGRVVDANVAYANHIGHSLSYLRTLPINKLITRSTRLKDTPRWDALVAGKIKGYKSYVMLRHAKGHLVCCVATVSLITHQDGAPKSVYCVNDLIAEADAEDPRVAAQRVEQIEDERLSKEENAILTTLAEGGTLSDVEAMMYLSRPGLNHHITKLRQRLGLPQGTRTAGLVARAYALGILSPGTWPPRAAALYSP